MRTRRYSCGQPSAFHVVPTKFRETLKVGWGGAKLRKESSHSSQTKDTERPIAKARAREVKRKRMKKAKAARNAARARRHEHAHLLNRSREVGLAAYALKAEISAARHVVLSSTHWQHCKSPVCNARGGRSIRRWIGGATGRGRAMGPTLGLHCHQPRWAQPARGEHLAGILVSASGPLAPLLAHFAVARL